MPGTQGVQLQLEDGSMTDVFHSVHIRTGSLSRLNRRTLVGEELFRGSLITGTSNDANPSGQKSVYQKNSSVVIVGFGSFAAENVRSAVEGGAKSITIVCRRVKVGQSLAKNGASVADQRGTVTDRRPGYERWDTWRPYTTRG